MKAKIGGGAASPFSFTINSESPNTSIDGEVLAIVYSNPAESMRTIAFLDGGSSQTGDTFTFNFAQPVNPSVPGFQAMLSLGIGYGYQGSSQYSFVDVNGTRLTTSAGGQDDGAAFDGALITVGGIGDDFSTNPPPYDSPSNARTDDEAYNLTPFLHAGDTFFTVTTSNPSLDDNIFFAGINITAEGTIVVPSNNKIVFESTRDLDEEIYSMNADGTNQVNLSQSKGPDGYPGWSPDGQKIVFSSKRNGQSREIYIMNADGSNQINISNHTADDGYPAWSPDNKKIAFSSDRGLEGTNNRKIYLMDIDGLNVEAITPALPYALNPSWSPDAKKLLFSSQQNGRYKYLLC